MTISLMALLLIVGFLTTSLLSNIPKAYAATKTWNGNGTTHTTWSDPLSWSPTGVPAAGDDVVFDVTSANDSTIDSGFAGTVKSLTITNDYSGTITQARNFAATNLFSKEYQGLFISNPSYTFAVTSTTGQFNVASGGFHRWTVDGSGNHVIYDLYGLAGTSNTDANIKLADTFNGDASQMRYWNSGHGWDRLYLGGYDFDGNNKTINGFYQHGSWFDSSGLLSNLSSTSKIKDLNLTNIDIDDPGNNINVGGLVSGTSYWTGSITNVTVTGTINATSNGWNSGGAGGLIGSINYNSSVTITNCHTAVTINSSGNNSWKSGGLVGQSDGTITISNSSAIRDVTSTDRAGGLVGDGSGGTITDSYATGNIVANNEAGGLAGEFDGTISNSYATGDVTSTQDWGVAGGLVGYSGATISNSYASGNITTGNTPNSCLGGIAGYNWSGDKDHSYFSGTLNGSTSRKGGFVGYDSAGEYDGDPTIYTANHFDHDKSNMKSVGNKTDPVTGIEQDTTVQMKTKSTFSGWTFPPTTNNDWTINEGVGYPHLAWEISCGGTGTVGDPYLICTLNQLQNMQLNLGASYKLANDIDASLTSSWNGGAGFIPIGIGSDGVTRFNGNFDGNGKTIDQLTINSSGVSAIGLFGYVSSSSSVIKNVGLTNISISAGTGAYGVGGLVGLNEGTVTNSYVTGSIVTQYYHDATGGLVGYNYGTTTYSYSVASVQNVSADSYNLGGFVGKNYGTITNSYSTGVVTGSGGNIGGFVGYNGYAITNSYSTGAVVGSGGSIGGFIGYDASENNYASNYFDHTINNLPSIGNVSDPVAGITPQTTAQMKQHATFVPAGTDPGEWDFPNVWTLDEVGGTTYPLLAWQGGVDTLPGSAPSAPSGVAITLPSTTGFTVGWTDNSSDETGFKVYVAAGVADCSTASYSGTPDFTTAANAITQAVTSKSVNTQYCAKVIATNTFGDSAPAYSAPKYTLANVPGAPTVNATSATSLTSIINVNSNPAGTEFAISCDGDSTFLNYTTNACESISDDANHWRTYANWGSGSGFVDTGLSVNTQHTYKVIARNGDKTNTALSSSAAKYTLANVPAVPTLGTPTSSTVPVTIDVNSNPASTTFAIKVVYSSTTKYIQANGTMGDSAVWQTAGTWNSPISNSGLTANTSYTYSVAAQNGDSVATAYGTTANASTLAVHTIASSVVGGNGTISPTPTATVDDGASRAFTITPSGLYYISDIKIDNVSLSGTLSSPYTFTSVTADHTIAVSFLAYGTRIWTGRGTTSTCGAGNEYNWTCAINWTGNLTPVDTDDIIFDATSTKASTLDTSFTNHIKSLSVNSGYTDTITLANNLNDDGDINLAAGQLNAGSYTLNIGGSWNNTGGEFTKGTSTVNFNGSFPDRTINSGGTGAGYDFYNMTVDGGGAGASGSFNNNISATRLPNAFDDSSTSAPIRWIPVSPVGGLAYGLATSSDGQVIYSGTSTSGEIQKSTNFGVSWTNLSIGNSFASAKTIHCSDSGATVVVVDSTNGIYVSTNSGTSWTRSKTETAWQDAGVSGGGTKMIAVRDGSSGAQGVYLSVDSGGSWTFNSALGVTRGSAATLSDDGQILYAAVYSDGTGITTLKKSTNGGTSWTSVATDDPWHGYRQQTCNISSSANGQYVMWGNQYSSNSGGSFTEEIGRINYFSYSSISDDGQKAMITVVGSGNASVVITSNGWATQTTVGYNGATGTVVSGDGTVFYDLSASTYGGTDYAVRRYFPAETNKTPYTAGKSQWYIPSTGQAWICVDDTPGAAVWQEVPNTSGSYFLTSAISATNNLTFSSGSFDASGYDLIAGNVIQSGGTFTAPTSGKSFIVNGGWNHSSGTFVPGTGTVTLAGDALIQGNTTFNNFTANTSGKTLTFAAASEQTISGTLNLLNSTAGTLALVSASPSSQWKIKPQETKAIANASGTVSVTDSNCTATDACEKDNTGSNSNITLVSGNTNWPYIFIPIVTTQSASSVTSNSAIGNGNITNIGGESNTVRGFEYATDTSSGHDCSTRGSISTAYDSGSYTAGAYTKGISGLVANTYYCARAYATNTAGSGYGSWVSFATLATHTLAYSAAAHGSIVGTTPQTIDYGGNGTQVTATPAANYHFVSWSDSVMTAARTDLNVTGDISVTATFAIDTYALTYSAGAHGSVVGISPQAVNYGSNGTQVTATPAANYHFVKWSDNNSTNPVRTDTNVTADITTTASFAIDTHTLTYSAEANGSIVGTSPQTVDYGSNGTQVTATPATNYHFVSWSDSVMTAARTDLNVTANITVTASFTLDAYALTYSAGAHGSIVGTSPQTVNYGSNGTQVTATPATGYHFVKWSDNNSTNPVRTDTNITAAITTIASFAIDTYTLTYSAGANGSIVGSTPQTVNHGSNGTQVTATPSANYHFVSWSDAYPTAARTDLNVTANISVTATFADNSTCTWSGGGADNNWSTAANWVSNIKPTAICDVVFDSTSGKNSIIDPSFADHVKSLSINTGYTGTITLARDLNVDNNVSLVAGTIDGSSSHFAFNVTGSWTNTGATFAINKPSINFNGIGEKTISTNNQAFYDVTIAGQGTPVVTGSTWVPSINSSNMTQLSNAGVVVGASVTGTSPWGVAIDPSGYVWVANRTTNNVSKFDNYGHLVGAYAVGSYPEGIAIDASGNVWVTNRDSNNVSKLSNLGVLLGTYGVGATPYGIAVDSLGNVWVANTGGSTVTKFSNSGIRLGVYNSGANPYGIAIDASDNVWVTNLNPNTVTKILNNGHLQATYSTGNHPAGIAIDANANVWVANYADNNVMKFDSAGSLLGTYNVGITPQGVAIDAAGNVWVANYASNTVAKLSSTGGLLGSYNVGSGPYSLGDMTGFIMQYFVQKNTGIGASYSLASDLSVVNNFTLSSGAFSAGLNNLTTNNFIQTGGRFTAPASGKNFDISGSFNHSFGVFLHNSGTVNLNGVSAQAVNGCTVFNNLNVISTSARTISFEARATVGVEGSFGAVGTSNNLINLISSVDGTPFILSKTNGVVLSDYLSIKDSTATGGAEWYAGSNSVNGGDNDGWIFGNAGGNAPPVTTSAIAAPSDVVIRSVTNNSFVVGWTDNSDNEVYFKIYLSNSPNGDCSRATYRAANSPDYTVTVNVHSRQVINRLPATQYCAKVVATNAIVSSAPAYSANRSTLANVPGAPVASALNPSQLSVKFTPNDNATAARYAVYDEATGKYVNQSDGQLHVLPDWQTYSVWGGTNGLIVSGLGADTRHSFKIKARNSDGIETVLSASAARYTFSSVPKLAIVKNGSSLKLVADTNGNSINSRYAFYVSTPGGDKYVRQSDGTLQDNIDWQSYADWGGDNGFVVNNLVKNTEYSFKVKAINSENIQTAYSDGVSADVNETSYQLNISGDENTIIDSDSIVNLVEGSDFSLTISAKDGYRVKEVFVDGRSMGRLTRYSLANIRANHTIVIVTEKNQLISSIADTITNILEKISIAPVNASTVIAVAAVASAAAIIPLVAISNMASFAGAASATQSAATSIWQFFVGLFGVKTALRRKKSGRIVEYGTNAPLPGVKVGIYQVIDVPGASAPVQKLLTSVYTDDQGYFGAVVEPGKYIIRIFKDKYLLAPPSALVIGTIFEIKTERDSLVMPNIQLTMDPKAAEANLRMLLIFKNIEIGLSIFSFLALVIGSIIIIDGLVREPSRLVYILAGVYALIWVFDLRFLLKKSPWGIVSDADTHQSLPLTMIRILDKAGSKLIRTAVSNKNGKYSVLLPKGQYTLLASHPGYDLARLGDLDTQHRNSIINRKIEMKRQ
ncbi:MAG: GLUG motif-containing protein [Candidatus Berkelbacteria bacterium]